ncbi:MAG: hypothetical protein B9S36_01905 [Verrucomicrobiia bacterium Tous-C2TDCM]|nr:MAG: hypothetical protein B9S36_01905 [Verrucomicrobiae bacterium Tous-C2TDCM]
MDSSTGTSERRELKHDAKPGYGRVFAIVFAILGLYLALILISSPGPAKSHGHSEDGASSAHH